MNKKRNRSYIGKDDRSEQEMWHWYWDVRFKRDFIDNKWAMRKYKLYHYKLMNERFINLRSETKEYRNIYQ